MCRYCLLKHISEGKIEEMERRKRRRKQLLDDPKEMTEYYTLKEEALDGTVEHSLWYRMWTCRKIDYRMNE